MELSVIFCTIFLCLLIVWKLAGTYTCVCTYVQACMHDSIDYDSCMDTNLMTLCFVHNRPLILEYWLWDEVRVDQGKEWVLSLFVHERMAHLQTNTTRPPHLQSTSKKICVNCTTGIICLHIHSWMDEWCQLYKQYWLINTFASTLYSPAYNDTLFVNLSLHSYHFRTTKLSTSG